MIHRQIYHISLLTAFAVAALLSSACSADGNGELHPTATDQQPVAFSATMADGQGATTRGLDNVIANKAALANAGGFGVFACYTGLHRYGDVDAQPDFMYNQKVESNNSGTTWTYSPLKYWPNGEGVVNGSTGEAPHYVSFMAYAPYSDMKPASTGDAGYCIPSMSLQHELGNPWITYRLHNDVTKQVDLLYATPLLDKSKQTTTGNLSFSFKHALACAGSSVTVTCSDAMKTDLAARATSTDVSKMELRLTAMTITYTLTEKGRLVLWNNGSANWQGINSESSMVTRTVDYTPANHLLYSTASAGTDFKDATGDKAVFYIPIHTGNNYQTATVTLTYQIVRYTSADPSTPVVDRELTPSAVLTLSDYNSYEAGKKLTMNFTIHEIGLKTTASITNWTDETVGNFTAE